MIPPLFRAPSSVLPPLTHTHKDYTSAIRFETGRWPRLLAAVLLGPAPSYKPTHYYRNERVDHAHLDHICICICYYIDKFLLMYVFVGFYIYS